MRAAAIGAAAFGVHLPFLLYIVIMPVLILITLLPISIAGLGVRELGFVQLFGRVGMPAEIAFSLSLLTRVLTVLLAVRAHGSTPVAACSPEAQDRDSFATRFCDSCSASGGGGERANG